EDSGCGGATPRRPCSGRAGLFVSQGRHSPRHEFAPSIVRGCSRCRRGDKVRPGTVAVTGLLLGLLLCAAGAALTSRLEARCRWWVLAILLAVTVVGLRWTRARTMLTFWPTPTEVERVAHSLAQGKGFRDPFGFETGPTAHVSPLYPCYVAAL